MHLRAPFLAAQRGLGRGPRAKPEQLVESPENLISFGL